MSFELKYREIGEYMAHDILSNLEYYEDEQDEENDLENRVIIQLSKDVERFVMAMANVYRDYEKWI